MFLNPAWVAVLSLKIQCPVFREKKWDQQRQPTRWVPVRFEDVELQQGVRVSLRRWEVPHWGRGEASLTDHVLCAAQYGNVAYVCTGVNTSSPNFHRSSRAEAHIFSCLQIRKLRHMDLANWGYIAILKVIKIKLNSNTISISSEF